MKRLIHNKRSLVLTFSLLAIALQGYAQKATIITMEREGTAGVYLSEKEKIACIIDGGRKGGLSKPRLDGKPVLQDLISQGYQELVISCSHPHEDHAAGLRDIVLSDPHLTKFRKITFIDAGYPGAESLYQLFREAHPSYPNEQVRYSSAKGRNAFTDLWGNNSGLKIENFEYIPKEGATKHGHATIHHIVLEKNGQRTLFVDFDDADNELLRVWAEWAKQSPASRRPDVVIAPHHNADTVDIAPLLDRSIKPKVCIITANARNKFLHPGPQNTVQWVESLGINNVLVTGAHENIVVTEKGLVTINDSRAMQSTVDSILLPMRAKLDHQMAVLEEKALEQDPTASERARYEELRSKSKAAEKLMDLFKGGPDNSRTFSSGDLPTSRPAAPVGPVTEGHSVGEFTELRNAFEKALSKPHSAPPPSAPLHRSSSSRAAARDVKFSAGLRMVPIRGGIILGNSISPVSAKVIKASISVSNDSPLITMIIEQDGKVQHCVFDNITMTELWAAYNFVNPNAELRSVFAIDDTENGLVGKSGDLPEGAGWKFGVHPAIAGTLIARDAMRLDMSVALSGRQLSALQIPEFETYQWYDTPAILRVEHGLLCIRASSEPFDSLLRIRFWTNSRPRWIRSALTFTNDLEAEFAKRLISKAGGEARWLSLSDKSQNELAQQISEQIASELTANVGANVPYNERRLIETMSRGFDAFRRIDRFSKTIAVLHWIADTCPNGLSSLPQGVQIKRFTIPAKMTADQLRFPTSRH